MSGLAERVVALAADQLPEPERSRRSEEWRADLEGAKEHGLSRLGIALGALTFAIGMPVASAVAAARWAQWALAVAAIGPVTWLSLRTSGLFMSQPEIRDGILVFVEVTIVVAIGLVVVAGLRTRGTPWVASGTVILLCLSGLLWTFGAPRTSSFGALVEVSLVVAAVGLVVVSLLLRRATGGTTHHIAAVLGLAAVPVLVVVWDGGNLLGLDAPTAALAQLVGITIACAALVTASLVLRSRRLKSRRPFGFRVSGAGFLIAAALAGVAATLVFTAPWPIEVLLVIANGLALADCVLAAAGVVLLIAPRSDVLVERAGTSPA